MKIRDIIGRQILDSRGNPTVEVDVWLEGDVFGRAAVPSGASTGSHEACELRDNQQAFHGQGVMQAITNIHDKIRPLLIGQAADDQNLIDQLMIDLDGTANKSSLGANAVLAVSLACAHAAANERHIPLYVHIADVAHNTRKSLPMPMMNILNGGRHAANSTDIQESMIIPIGAKTFADAVRMGSEVFHSLRQILKDEGYGTTVGDEGGFAPTVRHGNREALELIAKAVTEAGYTLGSDIAFALDVASTELYHDNAYVFTTEHATLHPIELTHWYQELIKTYPIVSIEDGMAEDDWDGWKHMTQQLRETQLVGDDLLVTNAERLQQAIDQKAANAILIKPNQIGTLTETIKAIQLAQKHNWRVIVSHRSGETEDVTIAHIAVGTGAGQIKTGSLSRSERTAKYNELIRIESIDDTLKLENPFQT